MRIGIDLDETISALPQWFSVLTKAVVSSGHEIHVITYREEGAEAAIVAELAQYGIEYTRLHVPGMTVDPATWKSALASELELDLMIEDSPEVLAKMPPRTARLWLCDPEVFDLDVCVRAMVSAPAPKSLLM